MGSAPAGVQCASVLRIENAVCVDLVLIVAIGVQIRVIRVIANVEQEY